VSTKLEPAELAYAAALVDSFAVLRVRDYRGTGLPEVTIQGKLAALDWLALITGVTVRTIPKSYSRHQCTEHCPDKHMRIESSSLRWQVTGARATIVLHGCAPFMRVQTRDAWKLIESGLAIGYKTDVVNDMTRRGWEIPDLREQPRARVALVR